MYFESLKTQNRRPQQKKHLQAKMIKRNEIMLRTHSGLKSEKSTCIQFKEFFLNGVAQKEPAAEWRKKFQKNVDFSSEST